MPSLIRHSSFIVVGCALLCAAPCRAQGIASLNDRVALESRAARAESAAMRGSDPQATRAERLAEASALRSRLRDGDFHAGDRITLWVNGESALSNTFIVRSGNVLAIPTLQEISLHGVLRSELRDVLLKEIRRFIKDPEIQVTSLITVTVLGAVGHPGFYTVAPNTPITDVLMSAGGPLASADFGRSRLVRGGADVGGGNQLRALLESNRTLDEIGFQSGDEIVVGERPHRWQSTSAVLGTFALLVPTLILVFRKH